VLALPTEIRRVYMAKMNNCVQQQGISGARDAFAFFAVRRLLPVNAESYNFVRLAMHIIL
jgi:hypothetical protein